MAIASTSTSTTTAIPKLRSIHIPKYDIENLNIDRKVTLQGTGAILAGVAVTLHFVCVGNPTFKILLQSVKDVPFISGSCSNEVQWAVLPTATYRRIVVPTT
jgi:hypothetical protein